MVSLRVYPIAPLTPGASRSAFFGSFGFSYCNVIDTHYSGGRSKSSPATSGETRAGARDDRPTTPNLAFR